MSDRNFNSVERTGTGSVERTGTGSVERTGTGSIERTGTGSVEPTATGRIRMAALGMALLALSVSGLAAAAQMFQIGGLTITTSEEAVAVSWHLIDGEAISIVHGVGKLENGYAAVDLSSGSLDKVQGGGTGDDKSYQNQWGQLELNLSDEGVSGSIVPFNGQQEYLFESGVNSTFLVPFTREYLDKVQGGGTGE